MNAIAPDMPLLMHGSGDVAPSDVNPDTTALLAELTAQYISHLVDAAVDAHDLLTDGAGGVLPPPPPASSSGSSSKRKRADFWDAPLPEPKIRSQPSGTNTKSTFPTLERDKNSLLFGGDVRETARSTSRKASLEDADQNSLLIGVDFWDTARSRKAHVATPSAIGTQCFIFPICHDAGLYGRVMEVQAARRSIAPVLIDSVILDMVETEGGHLLQYATRKRPALAANDSENTDDEEDEDNNEEELLPTWPGIDSILPIHK
jgi:hypothetical protein